MCGEGGGEDLTGRVGKGGFVGRGEAAFEEGECAFMVDADAEGDRAQALSRGWRGVDDVEEGGIEVAGASSGRIFEPDARGDGIV